MSWDDQTKLMVCSKRVPAHCWDASLLDLIGYVRSRLRPEQRDVLRNALTDPTTADGGGAVKIYFYASIDIDEESFGDWEIEADGDDLRALVCDELTAASPNLSVYEASRKPMTGTASRDLSAS